MTNIVQFPGPGPEPEPEPEAPSPQPPPAPKASMPFWLWGPVCFLLGVWFTGGN